MDRADYDKRIAKVKRALSRVEGQLLTSCGPAPAGTGATRRQIQDAFARLRATLSSTQPAA